MGMAQASQQLSFYNNGQINRMKIRKGHFDVSKMQMTRKNIFSSITQVLWPFQMQIESRMINVYVGRLNMKKESAAPSGEINAIDAMDTQGIYADWVNYELALFNIV